MKSRAASRWSLAVTVAIGVWGLSGLFCVERGQADEPNGDKRANDLEVVDDGLSNPLPYVPHQLVVKLGNGATGASLLSDAAVLEIHAQLEHANVYLLDLAPEATPTTASLEFEALQDVVYAHPNYLLNWAHPVQASYPFSDLQATGDYQGQYAARLLNLQDTHAHATGAGVRVAVIDGGIDFTHPALAGSAVSGYDFVDSDADAFDEAGGTTSGHGTFVAGAVHLVAPDAELHAYRIMTPNGYGDGFTLAQAIEQAVDDGCDVINLSVVLTHQHLAVQDALNYAGVAGTLVTASVGNAGKELAVYPAAQSNVLAVAAVDSLLHRADYSNVGSFVDLCAPGTDVYSAFQNGLFAWWSGTSFSSPQVAGAAALLKEIQPTATVSQLRNALCGTATNLDSVNPASAGKLGDGLVDPLLAVALLAQFDVATVTPDTLRYTWPEGIMWLVIPRDSVWLSSTGAPAAFTTAVLFDSILFVLPIDTIGTTDDWVSMYIDPLPWVGQYINTVVYDVEGAVEPARLTVILTITPADSGTWAWADPGSFYYNVPLGAEPIIMAATFIRSSNAPAAFTAQMVPGGAGLADLLDSAGVTDDSIRVRIEPARAFSAGLWEDQIQVQVEGVDSPLLIPIFVEISDSTLGNDTAWVVPDTGLTLVATDLDTLYACVSIESSNPGAAYFVEFADTPDFVARWDSVGVTPDAVCFVSFASLPPGTYADTLLFYVDGVVNNPVPAIIRLVVDSLGGGGPDTAAPSIIIDYPYASTGGVVDVCLRAASRGLDWGGFDFQVQFDTARLEFVTASAGDFPAACGWEYFAFAIDSSSADLVRLVGVADLASVPGLPACLAPDSGDVLACIRFQVTDDSNLACAAAPIRFYWNDCGDNAVASALGDTLYIAGSEPWSVVDHSGYDLTGQLHLGGPPWPCPTGSAPYLSSVRFRDGAVWISCDSTVTPSDSAYVIPSLLSYVVATGATDTILGCALVWSENAPSSYFAAVTDMGETFTRVPDSVGQTPDSLCVLVYPGGLSPGLHVDTIAVDIAGFATPRWLFVSVSVQDSMPPVTGLLNYPNPFNPRTEIAFRLLADMHVRLEVFNILGQHVITLQDGPGRAGDQRVMWGGTDSQGGLASSGVYFYRLTAGEQTLTGKLMLLR